MNPKNLMESLRMIEQALAQSRQYRMAQIMVDTSTLITEMQKELIELKKGKDDHPEVEHDEDDLELPDLN